MDNQSISIQVNLLKLEQQNSILREISSVVVLVNFGVSTIGIVANVANIATFIKQGFKEIIDISLTALAVTDMASLICLLWMCLCYNKSFCELVCGVIDLARVAYLTAGVPRAYFTLVSGCITTIVACERCLCVIKPLQVKVIFTRKRLGIALSSVSLVVLGPFLSAYYTTGLGWVFSPQRNRTVLSLTFRNNRHGIDNICFGITVAMCLSTYIAVFVCTFVIVWKLASQRAWRAQKTIPNANITSSAGGESKLFKKEMPQFTIPTKDNASSMDSRKQDESLQNIKRPVHGRDRRATQTVTFIAAMYIICFFPGAVVQLVMACEPNFNKGMKYSEYFHLSWSFAYFGEAVCSSANIVVYLKTSTRFRKTFLSHFGVSIDV